MKCTGVFIVFKFLYISVLFWSILTLTEVLSENSINNEDKSDNIQPTLLSLENNSSSINMETKINPSEDGLVSNKEVKADNVDLHPTDVPEQVSGTVFEEVNFEHAAVTNEIINNDTPIVILRQNTATEELQKQANIISPLNNTIIGDTTADAINPNNVTLNAVTQQQENRSDIDNLNVNSNETEQNLTNTDDIPSFSEWAQKHLEEAEKKEQLNFSSPNMINTTKSAKLRWKNYASVDCGAKVILANPEAQHTWAILVGSRDEYILNPCNSRSIWFIVELCEAIQLKKIDLANYELFSSSPKDFQVYISDRYPTRDWSQLGQFSAKDERNVQTFDINSESFGKYVKVEITSHYGSEHYCPLSLFRAYGMSVFEALQKDDPGHEQAVEDDDDDVNDDVIDTKQESGNLLSSATDAVLSMVKKAAQVLGNKKTEPSQNKSENIIIKSCNSPSHYVVCNNNCTDTLFGEIYELLSCHQKNIRNLMEINFIKKSLINSNICHKFGIDFKQSNITTSSNRKCLESFFPLRYLGAMCNFLAISHNKVHLNISHQYANTTGNINVERKASSLENQPEPILEEILATEPLNFKLPEINTKSSCSTDTTLSQLIKPTKSLSTDLPSEELNTATVTLQDQIFTENENVEPSLVVETIENSGDAAVESATVESIEDSVDKFITELNTEGVASVSVTAPSGGASNLQKESVFLRLSNRIKTLERNMSLSSQYLEELHKRYKKQVEDMQRVLEKTLSDVTIKQEDRHRQIEEKLESLTKAMENLSAEKNSWQAIAYWLFFIICFLFLTYCLNIKSAATPRESAVGKPCKVQRRNSVDVVTTSKKKKRRPSDQALKIVASSASGDQQKEKKRRKKSSNNLILESDWVEDRQKIIENIPFPLEESDSSALDAVLPMVELNNEIKAPDYVKTTAMSFRLGRSMSVIKNGKVPEKKRQSSPVESLNGSVSSASEQITPKKERKGFKKLFKKVF